MGPRHVNGWHEITWVERGRVRFHIGRRFVEACAGECLVLPAGVENQPWIQGVSLHQTWLPTGLVDEAMDTLGHRARGPTGVRRFSPSEPFTLVSRALFAAAREGIEEKGGHHPRHRALVRVLGSRALRTGVPWTLRVRPPALSGGRVSALREMLAPAARQIGGGPSHQGQDRTRVQKPRGRTTPLRGRSPVSR